jgi:signal transduction histidine kinase/CheY-like chemotaxis protein/HAMP domain-containing protein
LSADNREPSGGGGFQGRLRFRTRIASLVVMTFLALAAVTTVAVVLGKRIEQQISGIETRYVPLLELDRDLKAMFAAIPTSLAAAASAAEESELREVDARRDAFIRRLADGRAAIAQNGGDGDALIREFRHYYDLARSLSLELMAEEPSEDLAGRAEAMRTAQNTFAAHLDLATTPDRTRLADAFAEARGAQRAAILLDLVVAVGVVLLMVLVSWRIVRSTAGSLSAVSRGIERLATGDFNQEIPVVTRDEFGALAREANRTAEKLRDYRDRSAREDWIKTGVAGLVSETAGDIAPADLARGALSYLARTVGAQVGAAYAADGSGSLGLLATFALSDEGLPRVIPPGEGILGQAVRDDRVAVLSDLPEAYVRIKSALGEAPPRQVVIVPFGYHGRAIGVFELGFVAPVSEQALELLGRSRDHLGVAFRVADSRERVRLLLAETQRQADELRDQQSLLEEKAAEIQRASQYKSQFLANMSHELRTPLNSVMILSKILGENAERTLSEKQVEFAQLIHRSGEELLFLINDVLDLAKVEAGRLEVAVHPLALADVARYAERMFQPVAEHKQLAFEVIVADGAPEWIATDAPKLHQILKNLISNAIKFTDRGGVSVTIFAASRPPAGIAPVDIAPGAVGIAVADTGPGIARDQQERIFDAFTQADGGTARSHGGTGLGLTIARQLSRLLGGDLLVQSEPGAGSTFILHLPVDGPRAVAAPARPSTPAVEPALRPRRAGSGPQPADDRASVASGDPCLLVIEDDPVFVDIVLNLVRECGFKGLVASDGSSGLELARVHRPSGIILDVGLPDMDGWSVMERLKMSRITREIPVYFITAADTGAERARKMGAVGFLVKPVAVEEVKNAIHTLESFSGTTVRRVLLVDGGPGLRESLVDRLSGEAQVESVAAVDEAESRLGSRAFECVVLSLDGSDRTDGVGFLERLRRDPEGSHLPVVFYARVPLGAEVQARLADDPLTMVVTEGDSARDRVEEGTRLFLQRVRSRSPSAANGPGEVVQALEVLKGKRVLIVDDDMRNVYSLSSALRAADLEVLAATDGLEAVEVLEAGAEVDAVLMDIMMPRMDGFESIRRIRKMPGRQALPIVAITAKTMPGDRKKCLDAGASDYLPKPVDVDQLVSLLCARLVR